jgi:aspartate/methionine/tyrosine aminotransferase
MKINHSKVSFSSIVGIGQKVTKASKESGMEYLALNRGVNAVVNVDLTSVAPGIDVNTNEFQVYAPNLGVEKLRRSIAREYFCSDEYDNVSIMPGGMPGLDMILQTLGTENVLFPKFYWGSYSKMATIRGRSFSFYDDITRLDTNDLDSSTCVFICDPSNPTGVKVDDIFLLRKIDELDRKGVTVIFDCPYLKLFDWQTDYSSLDMFRAVGQMKNVIVCESFSKSLGVSGLRLGFIWSTNQEFNKEVNIRALYEFNGISTVSQLIINELLVNPNGTHAVNKFRKETVNNINKNIDYLEDRGLLVSEIYREGRPKGMFAIINLSEDFLFKNRIGAVGLDKFVYHDKDMWSSYSRICLSVPHSKFVEFFDRIEI